MKNALAFAVVSALGLVAGAANAASLSINPAVATAQPGGGNATSPATITVVWDNTGSTADGLEVEVAFDDADLNVTTSGSCSAGAGVVTVIAADAGGNTIANGTLCTMTFTTDVGAADGESFALTLQNAIATDGIATLPDPDLNNGAINIQSTPIPLTLSFGALAAFPPGNIGATSAAQQLTVTATGNSGSATLNACTAPAGIGLNPTSLTFNAAGPQSIDVTCTYAAAPINGNITCTETDGDSAGTPRNIAVSCPAGAVVPVTPTITSSPANGSTTNFTGGLIGNTRTSVINFTNTGGAGSGSATIDCSTAAPLSIAPSGLQTVTGSTQPTDPTVSCTLTDTAQNGSVTCTITDLAGTRTDVFNYVCPAGSTFLQPPSPEVVPTNSLWSKLGLIGLLAALGMLMVGFRRNH